MSIVTGVLHALNEGAVQLAIVAAKDNTAFDPSKVSPGPAGFIATAVFAAAVITLGFLLTSRIRRNQYRHEVREEIEAELAGSEGAAGKNSDPRADA